MGLYGPKTLHIQRTPFPIIRSQLFKCEWTWMSYAMLKFWSGMKVKFIQSACWVKCYKFHPKAISTPLLQVPTTAENPPILPSKPSLLPVHEARALSPKPILPRLLTFSIKKQAWTLYIAGLWAKSWMKFLVFLGPACYPVATQLTYFHNFTFRLPMIPFSLSTLLQFLLLLSIIKWHEAQWWLWPHQLTFNIALCRPH